jgi:hypothetical protein
VLRRRFGYDTCLCCRLLRVEKRRANLRPHADSVGSASAFGPLLIAHMRQSSGSYASGLHVTECIMLTSVALPTLISPPKFALSIGTDSSPPFTPHPRNDWF